MRTGKGSVPGADRIGFCPRSRRNRRTPLAADNVRDGWHRRRLGATATASPPDHFDPEERVCRLSQHAWLIEVAGKTILVDPCVGHQRNRALPFCNQISSPLLDRLEALGMRPEDVDYVLCTHLNLDHVGWNTRLEDGQYVPTFVNARYLIPASENEYWKQDLDG